MPRKGYKQTEAHKGNRSIAMMGKNKRPLSDEHKRKIRQNHARYWKGKVTWNKGKKLGPRPNEIKEKIRRNSKGNKNALGNRSRLGKNQSNEAKEKQRQKALEHIKNNPGPYKDTKPELKMKVILTSLNIPFEHQVRVEGINHLFDFRIEGTNVLIECDGDYWHHRLGQRKKDYRINRLAKRKGYRVIRFWEKEIMKNEDKVIDKLRRS